METYAKRKILLPVDIDNPGKTPEIEFFRGGTLEIAVSFFRGGHLIDLSNLSSVTLRIKAMDDLTGDALMSAAGTLNADLTLDQWLQGTSAHATFEFAAAETLLNLSGRRDAKFHLVIYGEAADTVIHTTGMVTCRESGVGGVAPTVPDDFYTKDESDALFAVRTQNTYTIENYTALRALDGDDYSAAELKNLILTLIADLQTSGVIE